MPEIRVGQGFDSHPFSTDADRTLILGGVRFPDATPLAGHSDADVLVHACIDALLGAAGSGDIGARYPDTDPALAGADSVAMLREVVAELEADGWVPVNIDASVVAENPKIAPRRDDMQHVLSTAANAPVTVKGKRPEGLGPVDGIACWAVALVAREAGSIQ